MSETTALFLGYGVIWVILGAYFFSIGRRQRSMRRSIERLERELSMQDKA
jgi:CcmD family protein